MDENVMGTFKITFAVLPYMREQKSGTIVTIGSRSAWRTELPVRLSYSRNTNEFVMICVPVQSIGSYAMVKASLRGN